MPSILYIHGTGVREPDYSKTYAVIEKQIRQRLLGWRPEGCYWGEQCGVKFHRDGHSIPDYGTARGVGDATNEEDRALILWQLLYNDPCYELFLVQSTDAGAKSSASFDRAPDSPQADRNKLMDELVGFRPSNELSVLIEEQDLAPFWTQAWRRILTSRPFRAAALNLQVKPNELIAIVARAATAQAILLAEAGGLPVPDGDARDALVKRVIEDLHGDTRSIGSALSAVAGLVERARVGAVAVGVGAGYYLSRRMATYAAERRRGVLSDKAAPGAGDILLYQTRGKKLRRFIRDRIAEISGDVILLAHSLGGIACVDLLIQERPANVTGLITAGSQAPLLYEMDCLKTLRACQPLPAHFPLWLNLYDPHDFLSYKGSEVFKVGEDFDKRITDAEIESKQPFPKSHSAYWKTPKTWDEIAEFVKRV